MPSAASAIGHARRRRIATARIRGLRIRRLRLVLRLLLVLLRCLLRLAAAADVHRMPADRARDAADDRRDAVDDRLRLLLPIPRDLALLHAFEDLSAARALHH